MNPHQAGLRNEAVSYHAATSERHRKPGLAGHVAAAQVASREFWRIVVNCPPVRVQLALGSVVVVLAVIKAVTLSLSPFAWMFIGLIHLLGIKAEVTNTAFERTGDAVATLTAAVRQLQERCNYLQAQAHDDSRPGLGDISLLKQPLPGESVYRNQMTAAIKDAGAATVTPVFFMALLVDAMALVFG